jgi:hypothetical protein
VREIGNADVGRVSGGTVTGDGKPLLADSIGARVPPRARAQVHSVFLRACNIETDSGELVTLLAPGCGNLPHGIRCASPIAPFSARLRQGQEANLEGATMRIAAADFVMDFSRAAVWNGTVAAASPGLRGAGAQGTLRELCETLREHAPDQGAPALFSRQPYPRSSVRWSRAGATLPILRARPRRTMPAQSFRP